MGDVIIISDTVQEFNGERFYLCGHYFQHNGKRLHRAVWEWHNGEIPEGYHIHHMDEDRSNNEIENLALLPGPEHIREHARSERGRENGKKAIRIAIELARAWHGSEEGRAWHSEHGKKTWENAQPSTYACDECGVEYQTISKRKTGHHFCGNSCKAKHRRNSGADNEERACPVCGCQFVANKYSKTKTCSQACARARRWGK